MCSLVLSLSVWLPHDHLSILTIEIAFSIYLKHLGTICWRASRVTMLTCSVYLSHNPSPASFGAHHCLCNTPCDSHTIPLRATHHTLLVPHHWWHIHDLIARGILWTHIVGSHYVCCWRHTCSPPDSNPCVYTAWPHAVPHTIFMDTSAFWVRGDNVFETMGHHHFCWLPLQVFANPRHSIVGSSTLWPLLDWGQRWCVCVCEKDSLKQHNVVFRYSRHNTKSINK